MNAKSGGLAELNPSMAAISYFGVEGLKTSSPAIAGTVV
jgi:hypothetical protein